MKKKLIGMLAIAIMVLAMGITVYGDEYQYNQDVSWLYINGINYNATYETERVDGVTYDYVSNTLTIENCNMTVNDDFISYAGEIPLKIVVKGNNTITSTEYEGIYVNAFINSSAKSDDGTADTSIYITGDGTLNLNKFSELVSRGVLKSDIRGILSIEGVTINTNGGGIYSPYGDIIIKNSKVKIDNSLKKTSYDGIVAGELEYGSNYDDPDGNGTITVQNSVLELIGSYGELIRCETLNLSNEYIYAGKKSAEYSYNTNEILQYDSMGECFWSLSDINYILITTNKLNYPSISTKNNNTTINTNTNTNTNVNNTTKVTKPGKVKSFKVKNVKGKKAKLSWKKMSGVKGFQIVYGLNKKCTKGKKTVTVSASSKSKTIKKLKKKKTYYFKIRAYKTSNGSKVYGDWSSVKKVKIKK